MSTIRQSHRTALHVMMVVAIVGWGVGSVAWADAEPVTITFMFHGGTWSDQLVPFWIEQFERDNPDIRVEWQIGDADPTGKLPVLIASGVGPDVFEMWGAGARNLAEGGFLLDLNPYVARDFTQGDIDDFYPISWEASQLNSGPRAGLRYGIPSYANVFPMYYNKDMFRAAGVALLPDLDQQGAWTWDTFLEIGKKLTRSDGDRITQWALDDDSLVHPTARGSGWIHAGGGKVFDFPDNPTRFMLDEPEALYALQYMQDLVWEHQLVPPMNDRGQADFRSGRGAINLWLGTTWLGRLDDYLQGAFDWDIGPRPMGPAGRGYYLASDMFGISANTLHPEEAWRFVTYLTSLDGAEAHMRIYGRGPVRQSAYVEYAELHSGRSAIYHIEGMMDGVLSPETFMQNTKEARDLIRQAVVDNIALKRVAPEQAVAEIAGAVRALYE